MADAPTSRSISCRRPEGEASAANFKLVEAPVAEPDDGQVLVRHHFLSLDPYMRGRMNDAKSYAQPQPLGEVMQGGTVGEVVESQASRATRPGDKVVGMGGWQEYSVVDARAARRAAQGRHHARCRCRTTSARSACRASPPGTAW